MRKTPNGGRLGCGEEEVDDAGEVVKVTPNVTRWEKQRMKEPSPPPRGIVKPHRVRVREAEPESSFWSWSLTGRG